MARARATAAVVLAAGAVMLTGCTYTEVSGGVVTEKLAYDQGLTVPVGNVTVWVPSTAWQLTVEYQGQEDVWQVTQVEYDSCSVGDRIDRASTGDLTCTPGVRGGDDDA